FRTRRRISSLAPPSATGWVAMSKRRKLRFSVRRMPLSTRPLARRSRTCFSWYPIFIKFHVSPVGISGQPLHWFDIAHHWSRSEDWLRRKGLTAHQVDPGADAHLLALLHH